MDWLNFAASLLNVAASAVALAAVVAAAKKPRG